MPILDPKTHKVTFFRMPVADPEMPETLGPPLHPNATLKPVGASAYWGEEKIWSQRSNNHNGMFDDKGRVWFAASVRGIENPDFCKKGAEHPSAKTFPLERSGRQASMLDPKTMNTLLSTPASAPITRSSAMMPTTRCGSRGPDPW